MKISSGLSGNPELQPRTQDIATQFETGDIFRAKIISVSGKEASLKLSDGTQLKAYLPSENSLSPGSTVAFRVTKNDGRQLFLEALIKSSIEKKSELDTILNYLGKKDSFTKDIVEALLARNQNISQERIVSIQNAMHTFKELGLTAQKAVFLLQNQVPLTSDMIQMLNAFLDKDINISNQLQTLQEKLQKLPSPTLNTISEKLSILNALEKLIEMFAKASHESKLPSLGNIDTLTRPTEHPMATLSNNENVENIFLTSPKSGVSGQEHQRLYEAISKAVSLAFSNPDTIDAMEPATFETLKALIFSNDKEVSKNSIAQTIQQDVPKTNADQIKDIIKNTFDPVFIKINADISASSLHVDEIYKKIMHRLAILKDAMSQGQDSVTNDLKMQLTQFERQLGFLNDINHPQHSFVQIPFDYNGHKNAELYIIKKNQAKKEKGEGTTLFLSLHTLHMGQFEALVQVKEAQLKIYLRLENETLIAFVKKNLPILYEAMDHTKYKIVDFKCKKIDEAISPLNVASILKSEFVGETRSIDFKI